jgi:hypothetical protein
LQYLQFVQFIETDPIPFLFVFPKHLFFFTFADQCKIIFTNVYKIAHYC